MPDSTRHHRPLRLAVALTCALIGLAGGASSRALADGDPASDVLASQPLFAPADGGFAPRDLARLNGLLAAAQRQGVPIRVALIKSPADLGSVGELWRKPQRYAEFLGQELSQVYRGTVIVVMPNGVGVLGGRRADHAMDIGVSNHAGGTSALTHAAIDAVRALALDAGHRLQLPRVAAGPGASSWLSSVDLGSWLVLAAGAALIAAAWTASLRTRPPRRLRRAP